MNDLTMAKNGITVEVHVNTVYDGRFEATVGDEQLFSPTWSGLEKLVDRATKRVSKLVNVPFTMIDFSRVKFGSHELKTIVKHGSATGLHSSNGHVLVRWDKTGDRSQLTGWRDGDTPFRRLSQKEIEEYDVLYRASADAERRVREWEESHRIKLKDEVIKTLNQSTAQDN